MKFATKLSILLSVIFLISSVVISYSVYISSMGMLEEQITDRLEEQGFHVMDKVDRILFERVEDGNILARDPILSSRESTPQQITERLSAFRNAYKYYSSISFYDLNRVAIADTEGLNIGQKHLFSAYWPAIIEGNDSVMDLFDSESSKEKVFYFANLVRDRGGAPFGVVVSRMPVSTLYEIIGQAAGIHEGEGFAIDLVDREGLLLYSSYNKKGILKEVQPEWKMINDYISKGGESSKTDNDTIYIFAREKGYLDFKGNGWTLIMAVPAKVAFAPAIELRNRLMGILSITAFIGFFAIYLFSRTVSTPLLSLSRASQEIGKGNLNERVEVKTRDEIGILGESFNQMARDLKEYRDRTMTNSRELEIRVSELEETRHMAEAASTAKSEFLANMAHELRTPLSAVIGFSELMSEGAAGRLTEEEKDYLNEISRSGRHLLSLINDILDVSKIETSSMPLDVKLFDLKEVLENEVDIFKVRPANSKITTMLEMADGIGTVKADEKKIRQVVFNLLSNAVKFTPGEGSIKVSARKMPDCVEISVEDTGIGISEADLKRLFQPFQQLENTYTKTRPGIGLGLYLSKKLIEMQGGDIWVESETGRGSRFTFTIPTPR